MALEQKEADAAELHTTLDPNAWREEHLYQPAVNHFYKQVLRETKRLFMLAAQGVGVGAGVGEPAPEPASEPAPRPDATARRGSTRCATSTCGTSATRAWASRRGRGCSPTRASLRPSPSGRRG